MEIALEYIDWNTLTGVLKLNILQFLALIILLILWTPGYLMSHLY